MNVAMTVEAVPTGEVTRHPRNVRKHLTRALVRASLEAHGQYKPLVVQRSTGFILAGNGTHREIEALGWSEVAVSYVDVSDDEALEILLVDNRTSDDSGYDDQALAALLVEMAGDDDATAALAGTGYSEADVAHLLYRLDKPDEATAFLEQFMDVDDEIPVAVETPEGTLYRISYLVSAKDRVMVNATLREARDRFKVGSSAEALVKVVREFSE
jgi:ParB-like chromosome segregation protein Spo0J